MFYLFANGLYKDAFKKNCIDVSEQREAAKERRILGCGGCYCCSYTLAIKVKEHDI